MTRWLVVVCALAACSSSSAPRRDRDERAPATPDAVVVVADAAGDAAIDAAIPPITIVESPMRWTAEREQLTLDYRRRHSDPAATDVAIEPRAIVLHYTAGNSGANTRRYFDNVRVEASRKAIAAAGAVNVSAHYVIDRDGTIHRLQPETRFARHCVGLNHLAVGIENVGDEKQWPLTDAQVAANVALVRDLVRRYPSITHLLGHHEVTDFRDHAYYVERDPKYVNDKPDPGARFMRRVRAQLGDLSLAGAR